MVFTFSPNGPLIYFSVFSGPLSIVPSVYGQVDIPLAGYAPHRTGRAAFPHPALYKTDSSTAVLHIHLHRFSVLPMDTPLAFR